MPTKPKELNPYAEGHYIVDEKKDKNFHVFIHQVDPTEVEIKWHTGYKGTNPEEFKSKDKLKFPYQIWKHTYSVNTNTGNYSRTNSQISFSFTPYDKTNKENTLFSPPLLNTSGNGGFSGICFGYQKIPTPIDGLKEMEDIYDNMLAVYNAFYFSVFNKNMGIPWSTGVSIDQAMQAWNEASEKDVMNKDSQFYKTVGLKSKLTHEKALTTTSYY